LKKILERGYQIHPEALKVLEARGEENALAVLESFSEKYSEAIVIEVKQVEELIKNWKHHKQLLEELTDINVQLIKKGEFKE